VAPQQPQGLTPRFDSDEPFDASKSAVGITQPLGFWDPIGLSKEREGRDGFCWKSEKQFYQLQEAEIKHGRVAMLAALGMIWASLMPAPGFESYPAGVGVLSPGVPTAASLGVFIMVIYFLEEYFKDSKTREPGNAGDPAGILETQGADGFPSYSVDMRNKEINHGRLAMSAVATEFLSEYLNPAMGPKEQLASLVAGPTLAVVVGFLAIVQRTPEYSEEQVKLLRAKMDMPSLKALPAGGAAR
jgi:hypothetical protein